MNKLAAAVLAPVIAVVLLVAAAVAAVTSLTSGTGGTPALGCHIPSQAATAAPAQAAATVDGLDEEQTGNAATIISVGQGLGVPPQGWVIAIATALQESGLRNLPHLGADNDHDSLGLFQQRPSMGWGTREQIMDPTYAATVFYERLLQVPGWQDMPLTEAAQAVQRSAFPDAYARHEPRATEIVTTLGELCGPGAWVAPVTGEVISGFRTNSRPEHYGIDIPAARGTPVVAAAAGTVTVATCQATIDGQPTSCDIDGGPQTTGCGWYVDLLHTGGQLTRYCHLLARPDVSVGDQVPAGQRIGLVGSSGHSTGPHLHFEVELRRILDRHDDGSVTVERRQTDPIPFLAQRGVVYECVNNTAACEPVHGDRVRVERHGP